MTNRVERVALAVLLGFTVVAVAGYWVFGLHPTLLRGDAAAQRIYSVAFSVFARGQVLLAAATLVVVLLRRARLRWLGAFAVIYVVSLSSELAGTTLGLPFGPYSYTDGLGPKWFGHVPLLIPLSWFLMATPSFAIARRLAATSAQRVLIGSLVLLAWDLALDPAMSFATKYWVWGASGPYYGMPWLNLAGWYATGLVLMTVLAASRADRWLATVPMSWMIGFYVANLVLSLGLCAAAGLYGAVAASAVPLLFCAVAAQRDRAASDNAIGATAA